MRELDDDDLRYFVFELPYGNEVALLAENIRMAIVKFNRLTETALFLKVREG